MNGSGKQGKFIVFEGLDGCGKTTQSSLLKKELSSRGYSVLLVEEPGGTPLGQQIRKILLDSSGLNISPLAELLLYEASRSQLVREKILPALKQGTIVIADRFAASSVAYQGYGREIPVATVKKLNEIAIRNTKPDITFFLRIPVESVESRKGKINKLDRIEKESLNFYHKVQRGFEKYLKEEKNAVIIDGTSSKQTISEQIIVEVDRLLQK